MNFMKVDIRGLVDKVDMAENHDLVENQNVASK